MVTHCWPILCTRLAGTYTKIGTIQRRLAWPLRKDDTQNREAFHILCLHPRDAINDQGKGPGQLSLHVFFRAFPPLGEPTESCNPGSSRQDLDIQTEKAQVPADGNVLTCPYWDFWLYSLKNSPSTVQLKMRRELSGCGIRKTRVLVPAGWTPSGVCLSR